MERVSELPSNGKRVVSQFKVFFQLGQGMVRSFEPKKPKRKAWSPHCAWTPNVLCWVPCCSCCLLCLFDSLTTEDPCADDPCHLSRGAIASCHHRCPPQL